MVEFYSSSHLISMDKYFSLNCFGNEINVSSQSFAIFSLVFIWLYNGKQGIHNKITKYMFYSFYPLHLLLIVMIYIFFKKYIIY